jgi:hypothetical protein
LLLRTADAKSAKYTKKGNGLGHQKNTKARNMLRSVLSQFFASFATFAPSRQAVTSWRPLNLRPRRLTLRRPGRRRLR